MEHFDTCIELLVQHGADINVFNSDGKNALLLAAGGGSVRGVRALLDAGADVSVKNRVSGDPVLLHAAENRADCQECVELLIAAGADVNDTGPDGFTALMAAVTDGTTQCMEVFVNKGADVNMTDNSGRTAVMCAADSGNVKCLEYLIQQGADVNKMWWDDKGFGWHFTPLMRAALYGNNDCVNVLIRSGADVNKITGERISAGADANRAMHEGAKSETSVNRDSRQTVTGADANVMLPKGNVAGADVRTVIPEGAVIGADVNTVPPEGAVTGAGVNAMRPEGATALFYAAVGDHPDTVKLLLRSGALINRPTDVALNTLQYYIAHTEVTPSTDPWWREAQEEMRAMCVLLRVAGEYTEGTRVVCRRLGGEGPGGRWEKDLPECPLHWDQHPSLKHICRETIRKQMIRAHPERHLFGEVPRLPVPDSVHRFLLYGLSLDLQQQEAGEEEEGDGAWTRGGMPFLYKLAPRSYDGSPRQMVQFRAGGGFSSTWYV